MNVPPWLTGSVPFPAIEDWRADAALCVRQNLRAREMVTDACRSVVARLDSLPPDEMVATLLRPEVFAFVTGPGGEDGWAELQDGLAARTTRDAGSSLLWLNPTGQFTVVLRRQGRGSRRESCAAANFIDPSTAQFASCATAVESALGLIERIAPGFRAEIEKLVECVVLVDEGASFRGASGLAFRGMIMLSPEPDWTTCTFAEELVHEMTHLLLDLISIREPLLKGEQAFDEAWAAPFRPDKRPLYGNFHALMVVARLIHLFGAFERCGAEPETSWSAKAHDYAQRSAEALAALKAHGDLSAMARRLFNTLVEPTLGATLAAASTTTSSA